jgi:hypothetical protein
MTLDFAVMAARMSRGLLLALSLAAAPVGPAAAYCPDAQTAKAGFVLNDVNGTLKTKILKIEDDVVYQQIWTGDKLTSAPQFYKGLFLLTADINGRVATIEFKSDYKTIELIPGGSFSIDWTVKASHLPAVQMRSDFQVTGEEDIQIGECKYHTLVVDRVNRVLQGDRMQSLIMNYSPDLMVNLKVAPGSSGGDDRREYGSIDPLQ